MKHMPCSKEFSSACDLFCEVCVQYIFEKIYWNTLISGGRFLNGALEQQNICSNLICKLELTIKMLEQ